MSHSCPTPGYGAKIGEYWKCSCGRWWVVADVDGTDQGAWHEVTRFRLGDRQTINRFLRLNPGATTILLGDVERITKGSLR